jgi:hypothetical protein
MPRDDHYATLYKQWRSFLGLALATAWIIYWWWRLSGEESAALAAIPAAQSTLGEIRYWWSSGGVSNSYAGYKFLAVLTSPLAFIPARYLARWYVDQQRATEMRNAEAQQARQLAEHAADLERIRQSAQDEAKKSQFANERHELVTRVGDIDAQLLLLESETDQERRTRILLNLTQFIYQMHAKFPAEKATAILSDDTALPKMIEQSLAHMHRLGLKDRNFYLVLDGMLPGAPRSAAALMNNSDALQAATGAIAS